MVGSPRQRVLARGGPTARRGFALVGGLTAVVPAAAQPTTLHAEASITAGYDSNVLGTGDGLLAADGVTPLEPLRAFTIQVSPGLALFHEAPRWRLAARYAHPFIFFVNLDGLDTSADIGSVQLFYELSKTEQLTLGVDGGRFATRLTNLGAASQTAVSSQPVGASTILNATISQGYARELGPRWSLVQNASLTGVYALQGPQLPLVSVGVGAGPVYSRQNHSLAIEPSAGYTTTVGIDDEARDAGFIETDQAVLGLLGRWRWDFSPDWSSELAAGAGAAVGRGQTTVDEEGEQTGELSVGIGPIGRAALNLAMESGYTGSLYFESAITPNILTSQLFYSQTLGLRGGFPLSVEYDITLSTSVGYSWNRVVDENQNLDTDIVNTFIGDVSLGWYPRNYPSVEVRYQRLQQFGAGDEAQVLLPNYDRDVATLVVSWRWPSREALEVPTGAPTRVDERERRRLLGDRESNR
ncbi:MAG: hypothetical protein AAGA56_14800 [Myxococcota bacterium]